MDDVEGLSASVTAVPVPDPPVWVGSPVVGDGAVTLTWEDPDDDAIIRYEIPIVQTARKDPNWTAIDPSGPNTTEHTVEI